MKIYTTDKIRNVVLLGHSGSGKTSMGCINSAAGYEFTLSAYGNSKHGGFTMANTGDVETVLNDLT